MTRISTRRERLPDVTCAFRRVKFTTALSVMLIAYASARAQPLPRAPGETKAQVYADHIRIYYPVPFELVSDPAKPVAGIFAWMFSVEEHGGFSVVLTADTAMRTSNVNNILKHSSLRLCAETTPTNVRSCTNPVKGVAKNMGGWVEIDIDDKALLARIRTERPQNYWRYVYEPNGRYRIDRKLLDYRDRK
jgi:hypothetical protein